MTENDYQNVLLAVSGLTPQIITETFYYLQVKEKIPIKKIIIITTAIGEERINNTVKRPNGPFVRLCQEYGIDLFDISIEIEIIKDENGHKLDDIRTFNDNEWMAKKIMDVVYKITNEPNTRIWASIAGGRKTMSAYLALAMQLFARPHDHLTHVLVWPPEVESDRNFYYPPANKKYIETSQGHKISVNDIRIDLAQIPIIRLRNVIERELAQNIESYYDLITLSQFKIDELRQEIKGVWNVNEQKLEIYLGEKKLSEVYIPGKLAAIYHGFCLKTVVHLEEMEEFIQEVKSLYAYNYLKRKFDTYGEAWDLEQVRKDISTIRKIIYENLHQPVAKFFSIDSKRSYSAPVQYFIPKPPRIQE